ncbi:PLAT/LH2 domain-containing protein [Microcoleus asticus]|uniref:PLAT domain-containing protein n=1 Tax=Microcoleus asticus IPMA8 TaxID=2563858 RepID=A0ABX2CWF7_9CYAN|nr:PLAT/LH2 domain-containing protein [Microcoleus asticus]NQE34737.1 hypothetical protein [Microcoleus asticus IPMA8]
MSQHPFYLIAHRCNSPEKVKEAIRDGANAVECDLRYVSGKVIVNHDASDSDRYDLTEYLTEVKKYAAECYPKLALIIFDCKSSVSDEPDIAYKLLETIRENLANDTGINILISVATYKERNFFDEIIGTGCLKIREGVAIDYHNHPNEVSSYFEGRGVNNFFYGNGISYGFVGPNVFPSIAEAIRLKASHKKIKQVYVWTLGSKDSMIKYLRMGVDGIFVGKKSIETLKSILNENPFCDLRKLATCEDDAFNPPSLIGQAIFQIDVHTGDISDAGTNAKVYLTLDGEGEKKVDTGALNPLINGDGFERGSVDTVMLNLTDVGTIEKLKVWHDNTGSYSGWFLDKIVVSNLIRQQRFEFPCYTELKGDNNAVELNGSPLTGQAIFQIDVHTGTSSGAGTDAKVSLKLYGERGEVDTGELNHLIHGNAFENGNVDTMTLNLEDVGKLQKISVWHNNTKPGAAWELDKIVVTNLTQQQKFEFPCDAWLKESDNACELTAQQVAFS